MIVSSDSAEDLTMPRYSRCSAVSSVSSASSVMPRMPFIGVRISWLMLARNSLLARLAASAAAVRSATRCSRVSFRARSSAKPSAFSRAAPAIVAMNSARRSSSAPKRPGAWRCVTQKQAARRPRTKIGAHSAERTPACRISSLSSSPSPRAIATARPASRAWRARARPASGSPSPDDDGRARRRRRGVPGRPGSARRAGGAAPPRGPRRRSPRGRGPRRSAGRRRARCRTGRPARA